MGDPHILGCVIRGLDPRIHLLRESAFSKKMDGRVKPAMTKGAGLLRRKGSQ
jgi:hypothetical protein